MSDRRFEGKVAVITGAGNGIGYEIARCLVLEGANVLLNDLDAELAAVSARKIDSTGEACLPFAGDAADPAFLESFVAEAVRVFGRLDLAVANAGLTRFSRFLDLDVGDLRSMLDLNLQGSVFLAKFAARQMVERGAGGRIVFLSSVTGHQAHSGVVCYGMTKAALRMLAKGLVVELAPHGITTNAVSPGATLTERTVKGDSRYADKWADKTPTGRASSPRDVANAVLFLLGPDSSQVTGQTLVVDGGWSATSETPDFA